MPLRIPVPTSSNLPPQLDWLSPDSVCSPNVFFALSIFESLPSTVNPSTAYSSPSRRSSWLGTPKAPLHIYLLGGKKIDGFRLKEGWEVRPIHFYWNLEDISLVWLLIRRGEKYCQTARFFGKKRCFHQNWVDRCSNGEDSLVQVRFKFSCLAI